MDTYDTFRLGVPAAIQVAREMGDKINFLGVRIDSGDLAYISKKVRQQLDEAGNTVNWLLDNHMELNLVDAGSGAAYNHVGMPASSII